MAPLLYVVVDGEGGVVVVKKTSISHSSQWRVGFDQFVTFVVGDLRTSEGL